MKRLLFCLTLLNFISCKKENVTLGEKRMPFDHKSYLYISHEEDQSLLRQKLLNIALTERLKKEDESKIEAGDEFKMLDNSYSLAGNDKAEYQKMQGESAEIIISYKDHLEFYFVPMGIKKENALKQLGLEKEVGNSLFWVKESPATLEKKHTYYLVEASNDEIKNNDVNFYEQTINSDQLTKSSMTFKSHQIVLLDFEINYLTKETAITVKKGPTRSCKRTEGNECECFYKIENLTDGLIKTSWKKDDLGLFLKLNNQDYSLNSFDSLSGDGHLKLKINMNNYGGNDVAMTVLPWRISSKIKAVAPFDKDSSCGILSNETLDLTPIIRSNLKLTVKGRSLNF
jgi:hypothetical protein